MAIASPTRRTRLNELGLGYSPTTPSTSTLTRIEVIITVAITGPIAPPIILMSLVEAEEIPVSCLGVREMIMLIKVTGRSAAPIPNRNSDPAISDDVEWNNVTNKNETDIISMAGINNLVLSECRFANITPNTGPNTNTANERGNCSRPTASGSSPRPEPGGAAPNWGIAVIMMY
ncbi:MAG: hypothetical protein WBY22_10735, partial [Nitrososphaeraceae archaeon]